MKQTPQRNYAQSLAAADPAAGRKVWGRGGRRSRENRAGKNTREGRISKRGASHDRIDIPPSSIIKRSSGFPNQTRPRSPPASRPAPLGKQWCSPEQFLTFSHLGVKGSTRLSIFGRALPVNQFRARSSVAARDPTYQLIISSVILPCAAAIQSHSGALLCLEFH